MRSVNDQHGPDAYRNFRIPRGGGKAMKKRNSGLNWRGKGRTVDIAAAGRLSAKSGMSVRPGIWMFLGGRAF
jgi:hypothetical protein